MKRIKLMFILSSIALFALSSCNNDFSGEYKLIELQGNIDGLSSKRMERDRANALGMIFHIEKIGDRYKLTSDDPDAIIFNPSHDNVYTATVDRGEMSLTFTNSGAVLFAKDKGNEMTWTLEKCNK